MILVDDEFQAVAFLAKSLPGGLSQMAGRSYSGYLGSLFMGLTLGIVAAPCIGPFVLGLLTWVAAMGNPWFGFLIFFVLSLGLFQQIMPRLGKKYPVEIEITAKPKASSRSKKCQAVVICYLADHFCEICRNCFFR